MVLLMEFSLTSDQELFRESVRKGLEKLLGGRRWVEIDEAAQQRLAIHPHQTLGPRAVCAYSGEGC